MKKVFIFVLFAAIVANMSIFNVSDRGVELDLNSLSAMAQSMSEPDGFWMDSEHYYNLTWMSVQVAWDASGNVNLTSNATGVTIFSYQQTNSSSGWDGTCINFTTVGTTGITIGFENLGIHINQNTVITGTVDTATGEGTIKISSGDDW